MNIFVYMLIEIIIHFNWICSSWDRHSYLKIIILPVDYLYACQEINIMSYEQVEQVLIFFFFFFSLSYTLCNCMNEWNVLFNVTWLMFSSFLSSWMKKAMSLRFRYTVIVIPSFIMGLKWNSDMSSKSLWCLPPCLLW